MNEQQAAMAAKTIMMSGMADAAEQAIFEALRNGLAAACVAIEGSSVAVTVTLTQDTTSTMMRALASEHPIEMRTVIDE